MTIKQDAATVENRPLTEEEFEQIINNIIALILKGDVDYTRLQYLFEEVEESIEENRYNIIGEHIYFKMMYLIAAYSLDVDLLNSFIRSAPLIKIDIVLTEILKEDLTYLYMLDLYKEYRNNQLLNMDRILKSFEDKEVENLLGEFVNERELLEELLKP